MLGCVNEKRAAHAAVKKAEFVRAEKHRGPAKYLGQCDRVRRISASNEEKWHQMMGCAEKVPTKTFLDHVDFSPLLEEDEPEHTADRYIADAKREDPTTGTYRSWWGDKRAWFLQTAGFEFIFVE